jgi:hypothetical protein
MSLKKTLKHFMRHLLESNASDLMLILIWYVASCESCPIHHKYLLLFAYSWKDELIILYHTSYIWGLQHKENNSSFSCNYFRIKCDIRKTGFVSLGIKVLHISRIAYVSRLDEHFEANEKTTILNFNYEEARLSSLRKSQIAITYFQYQISVAYFSFVNSRSECRLIGLVPMLFSWHSTSHITFALVHKLGSGWWWVWACGYHYFQFLPNPITPKYQERA